MFCSEKIPTKQSGVPIKPRGLARVKTDTDQPLIPECGHSQAVFGKMRAASATLAQGTSLATTAEVWNPLAEGGG